MCSLKSVNTGKWLCPSHFSPRGEFNHTALTLCFYCTGRGHFDCISFRTTNNVYVLSTAFIRIPPAPPQKKKKTTNNPQKKSKGTNMSPKHLLTWIFEMKHFKTKMLYLWKLQHWPFRWTSVIPWKHILLCKTWLLLFHDYSCPQRCNSQAFPPRNCLFLNLWYYTLEMWLYRSSATGLHVTSCYFLQGTACNELFL